MIHLRPVPAVATIVLCAGFHCRTALHAGEREEAACGPGVVHRLGGTMWVAPGLSMVRAIDTEAVQLRLLRSLGRVEHAHALVTVGTFADLPLTSEIVEVEVVGLGAPRVTWQLWDTNVHAAWNKRYGDDYVCVRVPRDDQGVPLFPGGAFAMFNFDGAEPRH